MYGFCSSNILYPAILTFRMFIIIIIIVIIILILMILEIVAISIVY